MVEGKYFYLHDELGMLIGKCIRRIGTDSYEIKIYISKEEDPNNNIRYHDVNNDNEILQLKYLVDIKELKIYDNYEELIKENIIDLC